MDERKKKTVKSPETQKASRGFLARCYGKAQRAETQGKQKEDKGKKQKKRDEEDKKKRKEL